MTTFTGTTVSLQSFLAEHAICRVWHTAFDEPAGDEQTSIRSKEKSAKTTTANSAGSGSATKTSATVAATRFSN